MSDVPEEIAMAPWESELAENASCTLAHVGKTSNYWALPPECGILSAVLQIHTDRVCVDGRVLPALTRGKGAVSCCFSHWWMTNARKLVNTQMIASDHTAFNWLKGQLTPKTMQELTARSLIIDEHRVAPFECVVANNTPTRILDCQNVDGPKPNEFFLGEISGRSKILYRWALGIANRNGLVLTEARFRWSLGGTLVGDSLTPDQAAYRFSDAKEGDPVPHTPGYYEPPYLQQLFYKLTGFQYADYQTWRQSRLSVE